MIRFEATEVVRPFVLAGFNMQVSSPPQDPITYLDLGAVLGLAMIAAGRHGRDKPMPFGPYLAAAGAIALFWGPEITRRWLPAFP